MQLFGDAGLPTLLFIIFAGLNLAWWSPGMRRYATNGFQRGTGD
jgi:hypothetical protein